LSDVFERIIAVYHEVIMFLKVHIVYRLVEMFGNVAIKV